MSRIVRSSVMTTDMAWNKVASRYSTLRGMSSLVRAIAGLIDYIC